MSDKLYFYSYHMDNRPIKGNPSGNYNMNFIDPTNDIPSYYDGMVELEDIIVNFLLFRKNISIN